MYIVRGKRKPLLGREWFRQLFTEEDCLHCNAPVHRVTIDHENALKNLLQRFNSGCSPDFSAIKGVKAKLTLKPNTSPVFIRARVVPFKLIPLVERELENLEKVGVIEKVTTSTWATPIVPILKRDGTVRICGDYKTTVNPHLVVDDHPLPTVDELLAKLSGGKRFTKLDLKQAYLQMEIASEDREILTLSTCKGLYKVNRLMYGIALGPTIWQREIENLLQGIPGVAIFIDDIVITGESNEVHLSRLEEVLRRFKEHNITLNVQKCGFFLESVNYCGYTLDKNGVHKDQVKMDAITKMSRPTNITEVRAFTDMINYYSRFIPNVSTILHPLNLLLRKDTKFYWSRECERSFQSAKKAFTSKKVLAYFDTKLPLILATDASPIGVGAVLSHRLPDGSEKVILYASQALSQTQAKYSQIDKEAYAIVFGVKRFYQYLYGNKFVLYTDHRPLVQILSPTKSLPIYSAIRMQHYAVFLQGFNYEIKYKKSKHNANADCLSRLTAKQYSNISDVVDALQVELVNEMPVTAKEIAIETKKDQKLNKLLQALQSKNPNQCTKFEHVSRLEFSLHNDIIMRDHRIVIPGKLRGVVLRELHSGHFGVIKMKGLARGYCWWPGIDNDIESLAKNCVDCQSYSNNPVKVDVHPWQPSTAPMQRVHIDFAGPFLEKNFFIMIDAYSKWPEVHIMNNITSRSTIEVCEKIFAAYGIPQILVSDNGRTFTSTEFQNFLKSNGIIHKLTAPYNPASNGQAERFVQTLKQGLRRSRGEIISVQAQVNKIMLQYRAMIHSVTKKSPVELFLGRKLRMRLDLIKPTNRNTVHDADNVVRENRIAQVKVFSQGERVACREYTTQVKWRFGTVLEKLGKLHYIVRLDDNRLWKRHVDQMRAIGKRVHSKNGSDLDNNHYWDDDKEDASADERNNTMRVPSCTPPASPGRGEELLHQNRASPRRSNRVRHPPNFYVP